MKYLVTRERLNKRKINISVLLQTKEKWTGKVHSGLACVAGDEISVVFTIPH